MSFSINLIFYSNYKCALESENGGNYNLRMTKRKLLFQEDGRTERNMDGAWKERKRDDVWQEMEEWMDGSIMHGLNEWTEKERWKKN